jgi:SPP1 family phage portal protein
LKASEGIPVYNYDIEPQLICFIRHYERDGEKHYDVYFNDVIQHLKVLKTTGEFVSTEEDTKNDYQQVPVVAYKNNEFGSSDISIIKPLIDAYDVLMSDSMNEFDRFSFAYLLLVEMDVNEDDAKEIKAKRMFTNLPSPDAVKFLTKDIPTPFIIFMTDLIRKEIHKQSFIPDVDEISFSGGTSGVTIDKWVYMMEYTASDKEAYMKQGLTKRLELFEALGMINLDAGYEFTFKRNLPSSDRSNAEIYNMLFGKGITTETLMKQYLQFIKDPLAEMEAAKEEKSQSVDTDLMSSVIGAIGKANQPQPDQAVPQISGNEKR